LASGGTSTTPLRYLYFFFQAEDGIRAFHVTGVQTCALPIYASDAEALDKNYAAHTPLFDMLGGTWHLPKDRWPVNYGTVKPIPRSEERRVGKECRRRSSRARYEDDSRPVQSGEVMVNAPVR